MTTYIVKATGCQLWRPIGTRGEVMPAGSIFESTANLTIKDILCRKVESGSYMGDGKNYAQASDLDVYSVPPPPPVGGIALEYPPGSLQLKLIQPDGTHKIAKNIATVILEIIEG